MENAAAMRLRLDNALPLNALPVAKRPGLTPSPFFSSDHP